MSPNQTFIYLFILKTLVSRLIIVQGIAFYIVLRNSLSIINGIWDSIHIKTIVHPPTFIKMPPSIAYINPEEPLLIPCYAKANPEPRLQDYDCNLSRRILNVHRIS
uniref:Uncharacterized protein n=1 Tax=Schistosoma haematobium TaxID=6185 RepID=A0A095AHB2_SCHHA